MGKVLRDGVLVDDDVPTKEGDVLAKSPVDGPAIGSSVIPTALPNSASNPVGVIGPLEGGKDNVSADQALKESHGALINSPGRISEANKELRDKLRAEFKDETDEEIDRRVLRKIESEGRAAADRDLPEARNLPHPGPNEPLNADRNVIREDGTVTTLHKPELTATYLHGSRVLISDEERAKYDQLLKEMNDLMGDTAPGDIPLGDPYYTKKAELDAFVARLKR